VQVKRTMTLIILTTCHRSFHSPHKPASSPCQRVSTLSACYSSPCTTCPVSGKTSKNVVEWTTHQKFHQCQRLRHYLNLNYTATYSTVSRTGSQCYLRQAALLADASKANVMSAASVATDDVKCQDMTGLKWGTFMYLFGFMSTLIYFVLPGSSHLSLIDQLFITLVKLRHNLTFNLLAHTSKMSKATVIAVFGKWIDALHTHIGFLVRWPDREGIFSIIPSVFKANFPRLTSIIDCFEIFIDASKNLHARAQYWSNYKKHPL